MWKDGRVAPPAGGGTSPDPVTGPERCGASPALVAPGLDEVVAVVEAVAAAFAAAGHRLYLVGGVVRDLLLGAFDALDDIDLTTDAHPPVVRSLLAPHATDLWSQGERFGTIGARVGGRNLEVTTHRAEAYDPASRQPVVSFGRSIEQDLSRRDFTINAMAVALPDRTLSDPFGGAADLAARMLRTPLSPAESFGDDPLRMLRAARFLPRFDLTAEPDLEAAAAELAPRLAIVSVERIRDELDRLLAVTDPTRGLAFLERTGLLGQAVPALAARPEVQAEARRLAAAPGPVLVRRAGLVAPLGAAAGTALRALRYPNAEIDATMALLAAAPAAGARTASAETVRRVVDRLGRARLDDLALLVTAMAARGEDLLTGEGDGPDPQPGGPQPALPFFRRYRELAATEDLDHLGAPLSGRQVMEHLGLDPGPEVGRLLARLRQHRLVSGPYSEAEAYSLLDRWRTTGLGADGDGPGIRG
jgi:poly(A) polymerase